MGILNQIVEQRPFSANTWPQARQHFPGVPQLGDANPNAQPPAPPRVRGAGGGGAPGGMGSVWDNLQIPDGTAAILEALQAGRHGGRDGERGGGRRRPALPVPAAPGVPGAPVNGGVGGGIMGQIMGSFMGGGGIGGGASGAPGGIDPAMIAKLMAMVG